MKVIRKRACDICGNDEDGVCRYRITKLEGTAQRTVTVDLCADHGATVEDAIGSAPMPARRGRNAARPVVSLGDIEAKKKPARKRASSRKRS